MKKITRSELLRNLVTSGLDHLSSTVEKHLEALTPATPRPPWAIDEPRFLATCENCRTCAEYCPRGIIFHHDKTGQLAAGTPYLNFSEDLCDFCGECVKVCPSGALSFESGIKEIGIAKIDPYLCSNEEASYTPCKSCIEACPEKALSNSENGMPIVASESCNGCGACIPVCPENAITIKRQFLP